MIDLYPMMNHYIVENANNRSHFCPFCKISFLGEWKGFTSYYDWHYFSNWTNYFSFGNSLAWIQNHMTKALHLVVKYQKIPSEDPKYLTKFMTFKLAYTWPKKGNFVSNMMEWLFGRIDEKDDGNILEIQDV